MIKKEYYDLSDKESSYGEIFKVAGPLIIAENMNGAKMFELVKVGWKKLLGEIIKLDKGLAYIQCYEETAGLTANEPVERTKESLSVQLGPGLLKQVYDGIQRPLESIADTTKSLYVPKGTNLPALDPKKLWSFFPHQSMKVGKMITGGDIIGTCYENRLFDEHRILLPPNAKGRITFLAPEGEYNIKEKLCEVEYNGQTFHYTMSHHWPVRKPRPSADKLPLVTPFMTGLRSLDALFPTALGGTCSIPFFCAKNSVVQSLSRNSNSDVVVYAGCGERGSEVSDVLSQFQNMYSVIKGKGENLMQRSCLVANTCSMPLAAREASVYTSVTLAEYFRDMGYNASVIADPISKWAENLREMSGRLGEVPGDDGYPAYLSSRLAQFYGRAGRVKCLGSPEREGTVTIFGTVSLIGFDYSHPVLDATLKNVDVLWLLDHKMAKIRHFPEVNWKVSYSNYEKQLEPFFNGADEEFSHFRNTFEEILQNERNLNEIIQEAGKDDLSEEQRLTLEVAKIIREDFLQQNVFSEYDYICPRNKTIGMMRCIVTFYEQAKKAIADSSGWNRITFYRILNQLYPLIVRISRLNRENPRQTRQELDKVFQTLCDEMTVAFKKL